jgi:hypothetical protein
MTQITPDTIPDYHFLMIAPNLGGEWFFRGARRYWERFDLTVIPNGDLLALLPEEVTVAVSILSMRDAFDSLLAEVVRNRPDAYIDALIYNSVREAATALEARANNYQPFGVPLAPTAIPPTRLPLEPTIGSILDAPPPGTPTPTPNTSGFVTQVPTAPSGFITQTPSPTPDPDDDDDDGSIQPTPGSIIGG